MRSQFSRVAFAALVSGLSWITSTIIGQQGELGPATGRELVLETLGEGKGPLPGSIRLTLRNTAKEPFSFVEPTPLLAEAPQDESRTSPVLGLQLKDSQGRESPWSAVWVDMKLKKDAATKAITLKPGEKWSKEYSLSMFHFWGPCGPAASLPEFLKPGKTDVQFAALMISKDGTLVLSNAFKAKVKIPADFFEEPGLAKSVEEVDHLFEIMKDAPPFPGELARIPELIQMLGEPGFSSRLSGALELRRKGAEGKEAVPTLERLLQSTDARDRLAALYALEGIGPAARGSQSKVQALTRDPEARVREKAAETASALEGKKVDVAGEPTYSGRPITHWIAEATRELPSLTRARAGSKKPEKEAKKAEDAEEDEEDEGAADDRRWKAREVLIGMGKKAAPYLIAALKAEEIGSRFTLVSILGDLIGKGEVPDEVLLKALRSDSASIRLGLTAALGGDRFNTGSRAKGDLSPAMVSALVEMMKDPDHSVQVSATRALGRKGTESAVPGLLEAAKSQEFELRQTAVQSLQRIGAATPEVIAALKALVLDGNAFVRSAATQALEGLGVRGAGQVRFSTRLKEYAALRNKKEPVKEVAVDKMEKLPIDLPVDACGVFFVVDRSGTALESFDASKGLMEKVLAHLGSGADFGIVFVDRKALQYPEGPTPAQANDAGRKGAAKFLKEVKGGSGSCPMEGLHAALNLADKSSASRKIVYYIGDGGGTCPGFDSEEDYLELTSDAITQRNQGRVEIHALGVGAAPFCENFLLYFTEKNGGTYTRGLVEQKNEEPPRAPAKKKG